MFKYIAGLMLLAVASFANAGLPVCSTGAYFEPARSGEGLFLTVSPDTVTGAWFTYEYADAVPGVPKKTWYTFGATQNSPNLGTVVLPVFETEALSNVNSPLVVSTQLIGNAEITFVDANTVTFTYLINGFIDENCDFGPFPYWCARNNVRLVKLASAVPCS
jgi:hypothetical protein